MSERERAEAEVKRLASKAADVLGDVGEVMRASKGRATGAVMVSGQGKGGRSRA